MLRSKVHREAIAERMVVQVVVIVGFAEIRVELIDTRPAHVDAKNSRRIRPSRSPERGPRQIASFRWLLSLIKKLELKSLAPAR